MKWVSEGRKEGRKEGRENLPLPILNELLPASHYGRIWEAYREKICTPERRASTASCAAKEQSKVVGLSTHTPRSFSLWREFKNDRVIGSGRCRHASPFGQQWDFIIKHIHTSTNGCGRHAPRRQCPQLFSTNRWSTFMLVTRGKYTSSSLSLSLSVSPSFVFTLCYIQCIKNK